MTALTRIALANARLQSDVRDRLAEVEESRRRLLTVADAERARLAAEVESGPARRLERVAVLLAGVPDQGAGLAAQLAASRHAIGDFALGVHPGALAESGLRRALLDLARVAGVPVEVSVPGERFDRDVETAAYFLCAEALTNVVKYARAGRVRIEVTAQGDTFVVEVGDDGVGGADPAKGSGLVGLADRLDVLGGTLTVDSRPRQGTRLTGRIPLCRVAR